MTHSPQILPITAEILGLKNVEVINIALNHTNEFIITVANTQKEIPCHRCGRPTEPHGKRQTVRLRHCSINYSFHTFPLNPEVQMKCRKSI